MDGSAKRFKNLSDSTLKYSPAQSQSILSDSLSGQEIMLSPQQEIKEKLMEYLNLK